MFQNEMSCLKQVKKKTMSEVNYKYIAKPEIHTLGKNACNTWNKNVQNTFNNSDKGRSLQAKCDNNDIHYGNTKYADSYSSRNSSVSHKFYM